MITQLPQPLKHLAGCKRNYYTKKRMKRIINWIKKKLFKAQKWAASELLLYKRWCIKHITIYAFKIVLWSRKHAQENFDKNIIEFYKAVRRKQAFVFKTKIISAGKGIKHYKILLVETPNHTIEVKVAHEGTEDYTKHDYVNKPQDEQ